MQSDHLLPRLRRVGAASGPQTYYYSTCSCRRIAPPSYATRGSTLGNAAVQAAVLARLPLIRPEPAERRLA